MSKRHFPFTECMKCHNLDCNRNGLYCQIRGIGFSGTVGGMCLYYRSDSVKMVAPTNSNQNK